MSPIATQAPVIPEMSQMPLKASIKTPTSASALLGSSTTPRPKAVRSHGIYFDLDDGRTVIDGVGGAAVATIGMGHPDVISAMTKQATEMGFAYHQLVGSGPAEELSAYLVEKSKGVFVAAAFLNSGSEAMEACIKLARQYWYEQGHTERKYIIGRSPSYHGNTIGALAAGHILSRREPYLDLIPDFGHHVAAPHYKRHHLPGETEEAYSARLADELEAKIHELGEERVMAFSLEPVAGFSSGVIPPPKGYLPAIKRVLDKYGILLIMDGVMCGAGRTGDFYPFETVSEGVKPDIFAMAKGLGGGYVPISAVLVNAKVAGVVRKSGTWKNSHTYQNHPTVCATALEVCRVVEREGLLEKCKLRGEQIRTELREGLEGVDGVYDVRGVGTFIGVELEAPKTLSPRIAARVIQKCYDNGLLLLGISGSTDGVNGEAITIAPAFTITPEEASTLASIVVKSIKQCFEEL